MRKINLQELSPNDRAKIQDFCKIIAVGMIRLEQEERAVITNDQEQCEKIS